MVDRRIGHQALEIALPVRGQRPEDDRHHRQEGQRYSIVPGLVRIQRQYQAQEAVAAQFEQHARQDHRTCRGRLGMRIRQPGMEGPYRHLDGKGHRKSPESNRLDHIHRQAIGQCCSRRVPALGDQRDIERPRHHTQHLDCQQQPQRTRHGIDHKLNRGVLAGRDFPAAPHFTLALLTAPLVDQEVHRDQPKLPKDEEDQQIEAHKHAQHAHFQQHKQDHIRLDAIFYRERSQDRQRGKQRGEQHHRQ